jgi:hypothetical protein
VGALAKDEYAVRRRSSSSGTKGTPEAMRVLVANEPFVYREVISAAFKELRPHVEVISAEPRDLDREFSRLVPHLVVCSRVTALVERGATAWVELYPQHASRAVVSLGGEEATSDAMDFDTLLSILDRAERLYESV